MTEPARVLLWAHRIASPATRTGLGRYVVGLTTALARAGEGAGLRYDIAAAPEPERPTWLPPGVGYCRLRRDRRLLHLGWTFTGRPRIEQLAGPVDVVHSLYPAFPVPTRAPLALTIHDLFVLEHPEWFERMERVGFRRALDRAIGDGAQLIAVSAYTRDRLLAETETQPDQVEIVWSGIDTDFHRPVSPEHRASTLTGFGLDQTPYVLAVGAINARKNLQTAVAALARIEGPLRLVVAGPPGDAVPGLLAAADRLGMTDRVQLLGPVTDEELVVLLDGALLLAHPSLDEGFGFTPLEAMAAGTPVVVANSGSLPEVVADAAIVVGATDIDAWAAAMADVATDPELGVRLREAGPSRAAQFRWEDTATRVTAIHARLRDQTSR